jgi:phosphatidylglycerophosphate synthase
LFVICFLTDMADGYLARKFKATSVLGSRLDSIGDDLTILAGVVGLWVLHSDFLKTEFIIFVIPFGLFLLQMVMALVRYGRRSSFHTYGAKVAAVLQGFFLCSMFLFASPIYWLFYATALATTLELIEEILLVTVLKHWKTNVHGLYWALRGRENKKIDI